MKQLILPAAMQWQSGLFNHKHTGVCLVSHIIQDIKLNAQGIHVYSLSSSALCDSLNSYIHSFNFNLVRHAHIQYM